MSVAYRSATYRHAYTGGTFTTITLNKPAGTAEYDVLLALVSLQGVDTVTPPSGWTLLDFTDGSNYDFHLFWKRAGDSEPDTYQFAFPAKAIVYGMVVAISGAVRAETPIDAWSNTEYVTNNTTIRAASITTTQADAAVFAMGYAFHGTASGNSWTPPSGLDEDLDDEYHLTVGSNHYYTVFGVASYVKATAGSTGDKDFTDTLAANVKHAVMVALVPEVNPPTTPVISSPEGGGSTVGTSVDLTASATDPEGEQVLYRWKYSKDGGADETIGDTALVASGTSETYVWDTSELDVGLYALKCWAVDEWGYASTLYASVAYYVGDVYIVAPADGISTVAGPVVLTGRGYLSAAGDVAVRWEVDTNATPDSGSDDYQTLDTAYGDQGESVSVGVVLGWGTWYVRACALDDEEGASAWTPAHTLYVLEEIRLLPGSVVTESITGAANKIFARVKGTAIVETATYNTPGDPMRYDATPREDSVILPDGDSTAAASVAASTVSRRHEGERNYSGMEVSLEDGLKLQRGTMVGVQIDRLGVSATLAIRELVFDIGAGKCQVTVGDWQAPKTEVDTLISITERVDRIEREIA